MPLHIYSVVKSADSLEYKELSFQKRKNEKVPSADILVGCFREKRKEKVE